MTDKPTKGAAGLESLEWDKFVESVDVPGLFCVPTVAPDGTTNFSTTSAQTTRATGTITANGQTVGIDCDAYSIVTLTVNGTYSGLTFAFESSPDDVTYYSVVGVDSSVLGSSATTATPGTNGTKMYNITLPGVTKFRIRATAFGTGTANIGMIATSDPMVFNVTASLGTGTNSIGSINGLIPGTAATQFGKAQDSVVGVTDTGVANLAKRVDTLSTITPAVNDYALLQVDQQGALWVRSSVTNSVSFTRANITTATTTTPKSGPGALHGIIINKAVASGVITIYDNTAASGAIVGTITFPATLLNNQDSLFYDCQITTGITIVTSAAFDLTVLYQ